MTTRVSAIGAVLVTAASLAAGAPTSDAASDGDGRWHEPKTIQAHKRLETYGPVYQLPNGSTVAFWRNSKGDDVYAADRVAGGKWSDIVVVNGPHSEAWGHAAVEDPGSRITVAWRDRVGERLRTWTRRFVDGEWTEPRLELRSGVTYGVRAIRLATARGVVAVQWFEHDPEKGDQIVVAVRRGADKMTILPPPPSPQQWVRHLAVDSAGHAVVVGIADGRLLVTTYGSDGVWTEQQLGPSDGYEIASVPSGATAASNRSGDLVVGWREVLPNAGPFDPGTTVVRSRPHGEGFGGAHVLTENSSCEWSCLTLGMDADGNNTAVYSTWLVGSDADVWFTRRDGSTGSWAHPRQLAHEVNKYSKFAHATAPGGGSVIAIDADTAFLAYRCGPAGGCRKPVSLSPPRQYDEVVADTARGTAAMIWGTDCVFDCEYESRLLARVYE
jgi:hypothetical protein